MEGLKIVQMENTEASKYVFEEHHYLAMPLKNLYISVSFVFLVSWREAKEDQTTANVSVHKCLQR